MSSTLSSNCPLRRCASYISRRPLAICDAKVQNSTPITTSASLSTSFCHGRRLFLLAALSLPPHLAHVSTPLPHYPPSSRERHPHAPTHTSHLTTMSRLQQDQFVDDEEEECCPLCVEEFDLSDRNFRPCPCGYQVCYTASTPRSLPGLLY
jgi:hypothetical protein